MSAWRTKESMSARSARKLATLGGIFTYLSKVGVLTSLYLIDNDKISIIIFIHNLYLDPFLFQSSFPVSISDFLTRVLRVFDVKLNLHSQWCQRPDRIFNITECFSSTSSNKIGFIMIIYVVLNPTASKRNLKIFIQYLNVDITNANDANR